MNEIPEDIMKTAREAWGRAFNALPAKRAEDGIAESEAVIARAIMAERERAIAAAVSKKYTPDKGMDHEMEMFNDGVDAAIAAIRNA